jgi:PPP family 3-phenylpropionic acid transporter
MPFSNTPYWRLSGFYFFYFASLGVLVPYWSIYLEWLNFSAGEIGELTAILLTTRIFAPYIWAWIADHKEHRMQIVRYTSLGATLTFSAIFIQQSYGWIGTLLLCFSFFWNASLPQF